MKKQTILIFLLLSLLGSSVFLAGCDYITGKALNNTSFTLRGTIIDRDTRLSVKDASPEEIYGIIYSSEFFSNPVVIDVRTPEEYAAGHLIHAINIDVNSPDFTDQVNRLDKSLYYIVYCASGYRSNIARQKMEQLGFNHVINLTGGITAWLKAGLPVEK